MKDLGLVIDFPLTCHWAVGPWLISDQMITEPRGWWARILARMVLDVAEGRLLADPGF